MPKTAELKIQLPSYIDKKLCDFSMQCGVSDRVRHSRICFRLLIDGSDCPDGCYECSIHAALEGAGLEEQKLTDKLIRADDIRDAIEYVVTLMTRSIKEGAFEWTRTVIDISEKKAFPDQCGEDIVTASCHLPIDIDRNLVKISDTLGITDIVLPLGIDAVMEIRDEGGGSYRQQVYAGVRVPESRLVTVTDRVGMFPNLRGAVNATVFELNRIIQGGAIDWKMPMIEIYARKYGQERRLREDENELEDICAVLDDCLTE